MTTEANNDLDLQARIQPARTSQAESNAKERRNTRFIVLKISYKRVLYPSARGGHSYREPPIPFSRTL